MIWRVLVLIVVCYGLVPPSQFPMTDGDGSINFGNLIKHISELERTVTTIKQTSDSYKSDITRLDQEVLTLKAGKQKSDSEILRLRTELEQFTSYIIPEANVTKTKLDSIAIDVISVNKKMKVLEVNMHVIQSQVNASVFLDVPNITKTVIKIQTEFNIMNSSIFSEVASLINVTGTMNSEIKENQRNVQTLNANLVTVNRNASDQLAKVVSEIASLRSKVGTQINTTNVLAGSNRKDLVDRIVMLNHTIVTHLRGSTSGISGRLNNLTAAVDFIRKEVAFEVRQSFSFARHNADLLKFKDVQYDVGRGYSSASGKYTAPDSGTYLFWMMIKKTRGPFADLVIHKGNDAIAESKIAQEDSTGSVLTVVQVAAGEELFVSATYMKYINTDVMCTFGGALLNRHPA